MQSEKIKTKNGILDDSNADLPLIDDNTLAELVNSDPTANAIAEVVNPPANTVKESDLLDIIEYTLTDMGKKAVAKQDEGHEEKMAERLAEFMKTTGIEMTTEQAMRYVSGFYQGKNGVVASDQNKKREMLPYENGILYSIALLSFAIGAPFIGGIATSLAGFAALVIGSITFYKSRKYKYAPENFLPLIDEIEKYKGITQEQKFVEYHKLMLEYFSECIGKVSDLAVERYCRHFFGKKGYSMQDGTRALMTIRELKDNHKLGLHEELDIGYALEKFVGKIKERKIQMGEIVKYIDSLNKSYAAFKGTKAPSYLTPVLDQLTGGINFVGGVIDNTTSPPKRLTMETVINKIEEAAYTVKGRQTMGSFVSEGRYHR